MAIISAPSAGREVATVTWTPPTARPGDLQELDG